MKKKLISAVLALVIVLGLLPLAALAATSSIDIKIEPTFVAIDCAYPDNAERNDKEFGEDEITDFVFKVSIEGNGEVPCMDFTTYTPKDADKVEGWKFVGWNLCEITDDSGNYPVLATISKAENVLYLNEKLEPYAFPDDDDFTMLILVGAWEKVTESEEPAPETPTKYTVTIGEFDNDVSTITVRMVTSDVSEIKSGDAVEAGKAMMVLFAPRFNGCTLESSSITKSDGSAVELNNDNVVMPEGGGKTRICTFTMPSSNVSVTATFTTECVCTTKCTAAQVENCAVCKKLTTDFTSCKGEEAVTPPETNDKLTKENFTYTAYEKMSDADKKLYYGGKLEITGLDDGTYVVTFDNNTATGEKIPRVAYVAQAESGKITMSCQATANVLVFKVTGEDVSKNLENVYEGETAGRGTLVTEFAKSGS